MSDKVTIVVDWTPTLLGAGAKVFQKRQQRKIGWKLPLLLFVLAVLLITFAIRLIEDMLLRPEHDLASFEAGVVAGSVQAVFFLIVFVVAIVVINRHFRGQFYSGSPIFERPWTVQLSVEGMDSRGPYTYGHTDWAAVVDVLETKTLTIISLGAGGFIPLPNDGLPEGVTQAELLRRIDAWRAAADF